MSMLRSVLTYMGLGPDEDYDDRYLYDGDDGETTAQEQEPDEESKAVATIDIRDGDADGNSHAQRRRPDWLGGAASTAAESRPSSERPRSNERRGATSSNRGRGNHDLASPSVRPLRAVPPTDSDSADDGVTVRPVTIGGERDSIRTSSRTSGELRPTSGPRTVKPRALSPSSFGDAKNLADEFKNSVPVIMNLQGVERDLARRLIDFASGITYALDGSMEKIASQVFLITPRSVEVSDEDRRRIEERGY